MANGDENVILLTTHLRKELIKKPPMLTRGLDISNHLSKMNHFFKAINVSDEATMISMFCTLYSVQPWVMMSTLNSVVKQITTKAKIMVEFVID